ncbi:MAG: TetR/AcrR family transcriptional regulator [Jatrophihabitans sp.]|nr:MAG: TetR/AcrR family transcriptional regulator [Jatrophihabitans sp.]
MNECLPPDVLPVNDLAGNAAIFLADFEDQSDLSRLGPTARRVLATAAALFLERGAAGTSVRDVTRACGLTPGALYNHFASKDDLLYTLVEHGQVRMRRRLDEALAGAAADPVAQFGAFVRGYVVGHLVAPLLARVTRREYLHLSPARVELVVAERRSIRRDLTAILLAGQDGGAFRLIGGPAGATGQALMVLDMCSRTSDWFDPHGPVGVVELAQRYVQAAARLVGASG